MKNLPFCAYLGLSKVNTIPGFPLTKIYLIKVIEKETAVDFGFNCSLFWRKGWDTSPLRYDGASAERWVRINPSHIHATKKDIKKRLFPLAERMGFEPMCQLPDNRISSAARYDHFDTFPYLNIKL